MNTHIHSRTYSSKYKSGALIHPKTCIGILTLSLTEVCIQPLCHDVTQSQFLNGARMV